MKIYLENPKSGAPIKNWWDGYGYWSLAVGEIKAFPEASARLLKNVFGFLNEVTLEEYEIQLAKLEKEEISKIKVGSDGQLVPKKAEEIKEEEIKLEVKKEEIKKAKKSVEKAEDAEPDKPDYWELSRGALVNECKRREIDVKGLGKKGVIVTKEQLINLLEDDDTQK